MPLYDYRCVECSTEIEVMHGIEGSGPQACTVCGGAMRKMLSTPAIHFKGSGWAKKDAQTAAKNSSTSNGKGAAPDTSPDGASGSENGTADASGSDGSGGTDGKSGSGEGSTESKGSAAGADASTAPAKKSATPAPTTPSGSSDTS